MQPTYKYDENSPVIVFKNGGFAMNLSNPTVARKFVEKVGSMKNFTIREKKSENNK